MSIMDELKGINLKKLLFKTPSPDRLSDTPIVGGRRAGENDNPYLAARRTWNDHVGGVVASRQTFQLIAILSLLIALSGVGGIIYIGSQSKFIPLIFREDAQANLISVTRADKVGAATIEDFRTTASNFIENVRLVTPDVALQRRAVFRAYAVLSPNDPATVKTNEYLNGTEDASPFKRAAKEMVSVDVKSVIQQSNESWQVDWVETKRDRQGIPTEAPYLMRALVTLRQALPTKENSEEDVLKNPKFIYVVDYNWTKQLNGTDK